MSTTVTYKGNTLTTVNNETKSLLTAGTWLEDDIEITDTSSGGSSTALIVDTTDSHGGIIREITTDTEVRLQGRKTVMPTSQTQIITADTGYDGIVEVEVAPESGGDVLYATGTVTPSANTKTISVDVDFEPTHAIIHADYTNWDFTSWQEWGNVVWDTSLSAYLSIQGRINNGNFQYNVTNRDISNITYSGGKFDFKDTSFNFQAGITYTWYAWRETT